MRERAMEEKLNLEEVGRYFEARGYNVQKLSQPQSHVTGLVKFENEKLFLKLASTKGIGERTKNEAVWNKNVNTVWKKYLTTFSSPKIFDEGYFQEKYWFVCEFVFGKPLAEQNDKKSDLSSINKTDLEQSAKIAHNILKISEMCVLPKDTDYFRETWRERLLLVAKDDSKNIKHDTKKLLRFIEERKNDIEIGSSHGDFTPWHILKTKDDRYFLVDGETAQMAGPKFYDVAYFYHRVYTKLKRPDLAESFLAKFKEIYGWNKEDEKAFAPVLASRIMVGYFDAERDGVTSLELNNQILKNTLD